MRRRSGRRFRATCIVAPVIATTLFVFVTRSFPLAARAASQPASGVEDADVARAIAASAYVIVDVKTGRSVREQRGEWLDTPVWPGSIAKLATFAAALDAHTLTDRTRIVCTRRVTLPGGRVVDCTHPPLGQGSLKC